jgi:hypothetical protein
VVVDSAREVPVFVVVSMLAVWLAYLGIGSIMLWALRFAWVQSGALGALMSGVLPLLMITVLVFFTADLWQLTARLTRDRLWQTVGFLTLVAVVGSQPRPPIRVWKNCVCD